MYEYYRNSGLNGMSESLQRTEDHPIYLRVEGRKGIVYIYVSSESSSFE